MRKIIFFMSLFLLPYLGYGQSFLDKYENQENVTAVVVNKKMFELMSKVKMESKEDQAYLELIKKLEHLKVFRTSSVKTTMDMRTNVEKYSGGLSELMRVNDNGRSTKIFVKTIAGTNHVSELMMFIEGNSGKETVLMSLTGDFSVNDISMLTKRMNLPGGEELNKAAKN